jgi:CubicO group peptidase (beta-lactamase class C family)
MKARILIAAVVWLLCLNSGYTWAQGEDYFPTDNWRTSLPEQQGMDSAALANMVNSIAESGTSDIHSMLVIRNGYVVTDAYFYPFASGEPHDLASVTKSVVSTLTGIAIQQGYFEGVEQRLGDIMPVPEDKVDITLEDLLTMRSGISCVYSPYEITLFQMMQTADWPQFVLDLPMQWKPGTKWVYCSPAVHLLARTIQAATGQDVLGFAERNLFEPLGIQKVGWPLDPQGIVHGWGDLRLTPYDMAKIGYLYLNNGVWKGQQLLPETWVTDATRNIRSEENGQGYGYLWWLGDSYYAAKGRGGQYILVVPDEELIVVITGGGEVNPKQILNEYIRPAIVSDEALASNTAGDSALLEAVESAALAPEFEPQPVAPMPLLAQEVSDKTFLLDANLGGLLTASISFNTANEAILHLTGDRFLVGDDDFSWTVGLDGVPRVAPGRYDLPASGTGQWTGDKTFTMLVDEISNNNTWQISLTFGTENVTLALRSDVGALRVSGSIQK